MYWSISLVTLLLIDFLALVCNLMTLILVAYIIIVREPTVHRSGTNVTLSLSLATLIANLDGTWRPAGL